YALAVRHDPDTTRRGRCGRSARLRVKAAGDGDAAWCKWIDIRHGFHPAAHVARLADIAVGGESGAAVGVAVHTGTVAEIHSSYSGTVLAVGQAIHTVRTIAIRKAAMPETFAAHAHAISIAVAGNGPYSVSSAFVLPRDSGRPGSVNPVDAVIQSAEPPHPVIVLRVPYYRGCSVK